MSDLIHPTAIVDPAAEIETGVRIGPFCVIEAGVRIGEGTKLGPYVHIEGIAEIGRDNDIGTGVTIGHPPQHLAYDGAASGVRIGDRNVFREYANVQRAFKEGDFTTIGDGGFYMGFTHIGHDCHVGNGVIMANNSVLAGHVTMGDKVFMSGLTGVHQFGRVGRLVMIGGLARVVQDVPPFMIVEGHPAFLRALNSIGLKRAGLSIEARKELKALYKRLYRGEDRTSDVLRNLDESTLCPEARELVDFYKNSPRGVTTFRAYRKGEA